MLTATLGIDPGLSGGMALYDLQTGAMVVAKIPVHHKTTAKGTRKKVLDLHAIRDWLDLFTGSHVHAWVEDPHAMPGQGVVAMFTFGQVCGVMQMAVVMAHMPMTLVAPVTWKGQMGLSKDKDHARRRASQLMPAYAHCWAQSGQDGLAEAALLAYYGAHRP